MEESKQSKANQYKYHAFISYRHADNKEQGRQWATWLHQAIETYEVPKDLVGKKNGLGDVIPARIYPIFRDEEELPAHADLGTSIVGALEQTNLLVVLCSPRAVASTYVADEIDYFKKLGGSDRIIAAMIDGEPNTSWDDSKQKLGFTKEDECFPLPLQFEYDQDGNPTDKHAEPIAADFRINNNGTPEEGWTTPAAYREHLKATTQLDNKAIDKKVDTYQQQLHLMLLKIIAGILGVPLGELTQRDKEYQLEQERLKAKKLRQWLGAVTMLAILAVGAGVLAFVNSIRVTEEKHKTEQALIDSTHNYVLALNETSKNLLTSKEHNLSNIFNLYVHSYKEDSKTSPRLPSNFLQSNSTEVFNYITPIHNQHGINNIVFSNDSNLMATSSGYGDVFLWDTKTGNGRELRGINSARKITHIKFSLDNDFLVLGIGNDEIQVIDLRSNKDSVVSYIDTNELKHLTFSSDSNSIIAYTFEGLILKLNLQGDLVSTETQTENRKDFTVSDDGELMVFCSENQSLLVKSKEFTKEINIKLNDKSCNQSVLISPNNESAIVNHSNYLTLLDLKTGETERIKNINGDIENLSFSADSRKLALSIEKDVLIYDIQLKKIDWQMRLNSDVYSLSFSPDNRWVVAGGMARLSVFSVETGESINEITHHFNDFGLRNIAFNDEKLVFYSHSGVFHINMITGIVKQDVRVSGTCINIIESGKYLICINENKELRIFDIEKKQYLNHKLDISSFGELTSIAHFAMDKIYIGNSSGSLFIVDITNQTEKLLFNFNDKISHLEISNDGRFLAINLKKGQLTVSDLKLNTSFTVAGRNTHMSFSSDSNLLAFGSYSDNDIKVKIINTITGESEFEVDIGNKQFGGAVFSPVDNTLAIALDDTLYFWDPQNKEILNKVTSIHGWIYSMKYAPDGRTLLYSTDKGVSIVKVNKPAYNQISENILTNEINDDYITDFHFSDNSQLLGVTSQNGVLNILDVVTGQSNKVDGVTNTISSIKFSPDSNNILIGDKDGTLYFYDIFKNSSRKIIAHKADVEHISFSPSGNYFLSSSNKEIKLWDYQNRETLGSFQLNNKISNLGFIGEGGFFVNTGMNSSISTYNLLTKRWNYELSASLLSPNRKFQIFNNGVGGRPSKLKDTSNNFEYALNSKKYYFSPNNTWLLGISNNSLLKVHNLNSMEVNEFYWGGGIRDLIRFSNNNKIAVHHKSRKIEILNFENITQSKTGWKKKTQENEKHLNYVLEGLELKYKAPTPNFLGNSINIKWTKDQPLYWQTKANQNDAESLIQLGIIAQREQNWDLAHFWYQKAKSVGHKDAAFRLKLNGLMRTHYSTKDVPIEELK